jgi:flagellar L-ring protein precursor FlgH
MVKTYAKFAALALLGSTTTTVCHADSLYAAAASTTSGGAAPVNYFTDPKAHAVGDILTVEISETANGSATGTTTGAKSESANFGPGTGNVLSLIRELGLNGSENSSATGTSTRADNLTATIACTVTQVLPNGNMLIEGSRTVGVNAEKQTITLTGTVRPIDIGQGNTVQSQMVAGAKISYSGKGPVGEVQHDGIVRQIFKYLF